MFDPPQQNPTQPAPRQEPLQPAPEPVPSRHPREPEDILGAIDPAPSPRPKPVKGAFSPMAKKAPAPSSVPVQENVQTPVPDIFSQTPQPVAPSQALYQQQPPPPPVRPKVPTIDRSRPRPAILEPKTPSQGPMVPILPEIQEREQRMQTQDIFSDTDRTRPKIKSPSYSFPQPGLPTPENPPIGPKSPKLPRLPHMPQDKPSLLNWRFFIIIIVSLVVLAALGFGIYYAYITFFSPQSEEEMISPDDISNNDDETIPTPIATPSITPTITPTPTPAPEPDIDSDLDGLTDKEEALYGTDPQKVDSDSDGLTDKDEAKTYNTDPLNADTDGDGFPDGQEFLNGYDPKGPGKLGD